MIQETGLTGSNDAVTVHYDVAYTVGQEAGVSGEQYALAPGAEVNVLFTNTWKRHTGSLTVSKTAANAAGETFLFQITGPNGFSMTLPLQAGQSRTIYDLPLGDYTVTENTAWSWRYTSAYRSQSIELGSNPDENVVTFANSRTVWQWLSGDDGKILKQVPGKPVYTATLVKYADLICARPNGQGVIYGITEA